MPTARKALRRPIAKTTGAKTTGAKTTGRHTSAKPASAKRAKAQPATKPSVAKPARKPVARVSKADMSHAAGDGITLHRIDHLTLRVFPEMMEKLRDFYGAVLGLKPGKRPNFVFPGYWLYLGDRAAVHIAANAHPGTPSGESGATLGFDHVSFRTSGLKAMRARLTRLNVAFQEAPVPGFPLHQVFFRDPAGMKVELTFDSAECQD